MNAKPFVIKQHEVEHAKWVELNQQEMEKVSGGMAVNPMCPGNKFATITCSPSGCHNDGCDAD